MGGTLDSSRFKYQLSQHLGCSPSDLNAIVVGGHGDTTMIPLISKATWNSIPVTKFLSEEQQKQIDQQQGQIASLSKVNADLNERLRAIENSLAKTRGAKRRGR